MANNNKHTGPNVPALRFPEFSGEWEKMSLQDCCSDFSYGLNAPAKAYDGVNKYIRITDIDENTSVYKSDDPVSPDGLMSDEYLVNENDILFARTGASTGKTYLYNQNDGRLFYAGFLIKANVNNNCDPYFIFSQTKTQSYRRWVEIMSTRSGQPGINSQEYASYPLYVPSKEEQEKIALLLRGLDKRILVQSKIIEELTALRSALHQGIMSTGLEDGSWRMQTLAEVLSERTELNNEGHAVHSVSVSKGIVNQIEYLGRSFAAKDTSRYHVAYPGDVIYTKSPTGEFPYGIVKQSQISIKAALSPLYGVYVPISPEIGYIIHNHFLSAKNALNYLHPLIQKGAKNTINITNQRFLQNSMPLPTNKNAASLYYNAIKTVSDKIILEEMVMEKFQSQKSFLLKTMFI